MQKKSASAAVYTFLVRTHCHCSAQRLCTESVAQSDLASLSSVQALAVTTLGAASAAQRQDTIVDGEDRQFYLQYFFPNSSVGEVRHTKEQGTVSP